MIVVLHNIRSIYNVGSIFRTADALGDIEKIFLCGITPAPVNEIGAYKQAFTKTALGAEKTISWEKKKSTAVVLKNLRAQNKELEVVAVEQDRRSVPFHQFIPKSALKNIVLVLGGEIQGVPKIALDSADAIVEIPMQGKKESLNIAISFAIVSFFLKYKVIKH
ncbi:MAG: RNA methyltransferase [Candidatus Niyogibacteria bacterium CG10_big_fil_rev_8_21_14_0_10_46_36]|uniref:RNA methyltransferase n=1 Tax=Candidatus Niyogibacteria bacterium CG10_big_fil_rev_8_21_14_0_10_46_36 TaxID=1974726 RepID=A0A2H0TD82_9BACT|nr:MAG: RNA methyltransferase [Candidatus Niyogibacteria bacterium CG10_big_fil_rev_8_21_14_0_10_46_36]